MPFIKFSSFRKVNSLDAEIRGASFCAAAGLVVMVSSDPVRLSVNPTGSGNGKVSNASLDTAEDVALLSRDIALVRTGAHVVWSMLDIAHTAKIEEAARDVRILRGRPAGNEALGLTWDGSAVHFTTTKNDVEARTFPLRGDVRALDLTETECFVVVDGEGGGQLRVHPGATPEPGAVLRATLPAEAASFDKLRAGPRLAVVYKSGSSTACVAPGAPNALRPKLVRLEAKAVDLAVLETSLFALYEDGRCALYDSEAIAAAGDGQLVAKHTMQIGGGPPRVALTVGRGPATIWVGTSRGEVMSANIGRKTT